MTHRNGRHIRILIQDEIDAVDIELDAALQANRTPNVQLRRLDDLYRSALDQI